MDYEAAQLLVEEHAQVARDHFVRVAVAQRDAEEIS